MLRQIAFAGAFLLPLVLSAQTPSSWPSCAALRDDGARLACFDRWAAGQQAPAPVTQAPPALPAALPAHVAATAAPVRLTTQEGCRDTRYTALSRFWELERGSDCGTFGLRSLRPLVAAAAFADTVNRQPTSENPANNAATPIDYSTREMRLQLSVRSKLAQNLLAAPASGLSDSIWFAYSQQSYWQLFTPGISRPFRSTDHEPEVMYVYPLQAELAGWRLRYGGAGIVHHSNGQSLPYSRSWNRAYLMAGAESGNLQLQGRIWRRLDEDRANDDNPNISDFFGRAELQASWRPNDAHLLAVTARHSLRRTGRGSLRLEWFRTLWEGGDGGGLQLYTQYFTGYGDTLLDYNRRRSVFSVGLSLAEW
ncbi:MAG TPA: phospholipase A [Ramlibacter sp.]|uniref:phospholipase A n=1 Tax=Ramlibacter sp. TaxID=1917967 RepID=UPI002ED59251